jgi:hypothetical protein
MCYGRETPSGASQQMNDAILVNQPGERRASAVAVFRRLEEYMIS